MSKGTEINWHFEKSYVLGKKYEDMFISIVKDMKARQYPIKIVRFIFRDQTGTVEASESPNGKICYNRILNIFETMSKMNKN